jgi:hypothetical protein
MGNECQNICDNINNPREVLVSAQRDQDTSLRQLSINLKTEGVAPDEYFSKVTTEPIRELP